MKKYFDAQGNRIVFIEQEASPSYWDSQWDVNNFEEVVKNGLNNRLIVKTTKKFIPTEKTRKILEGGCGNGQFVYAFHKLGYDAYGVDYAPKTINKIKTSFPHLNVRAGDVRSLEFPDAYFDGYWSIGVIEHFFDGYQPILREMKRVLKDGGYLFLTFPHLSILRRLKIRLGCYPPFNSHIDQKEKFYQFALDHNQLIKELTGNGFKLVRKTPYAGMKGLKDEAPLLKPWLQKIYDSQNLLVKVLNYGISCLFAPFSSHSILLVFKKAGSSEKKKNRTLWEKYPIKIINRLAIHFFCWLDNFSYKVISFLAIKDNGGIHPKHKISDYHQFFVDNIRPSDSVLDIGYGSGFVAYHIAQKARKVTGIDIVKKNIILSKKEYCLDNMRFIEGDATTYQFTETFDVIILSNVLEHIRKRKEFLKNIKKLAPKFLIRVPMITRDWLSVYKKNQGFNYKLDDTHFIEYSEENFRSELEKSGLRIESTCVKFGELYAIVSVLSQKSNPL